MCPQEKSGYGVTEWDLKGVPKKPYFRYFCYFWSHIDIVEKLHVFLTFFQNHFNRELCTTSPVLMFDIQLLMHTTNIDILLILIMRSFSCEVGAKAGCKLPLPLSGWSALLSSRVIGSKQDNWAFEA